MSLSESRERVEAAQRDLGRAVIYAKNSKVSITIHAPNCYKIASWRGWHYLYWPGTATVMGFGVDQKINGNAACTLMKLIHEICAISQRERETDIPAFTRTKFNDGPHLDEINQEVGDRRRALCRPSKIRAPSFNACSARAI
jgi:hypothetical protein